jgi:site-specific DNA recombinase
LADALAGRSSADARTEELTTAMEQIQARLDDLPAAFAAGEITRRDWNLARKPLTEKLEHVQRQLARTTRSTALAGLVGNGDDLRRSWGGLNLSRQHAIVQALIDHATIGAGTQGARSLDPARVSVAWRH